jgi:hypothetical protein
MCIIGDADASAFVDMVSNHMIGGQMNLYSSFLGLGQDFHHLNS